MTSTKIAILVSLKLKKMQSVYDVHCKKDIKKIYLEMIGQMNG